MQYVLTFAEVIWDVRDRGWLGSGGAALGSVLLILSVYIGTCVGENGSRCKLVEVVVLSHTVRGMVITKYLFRNVGKTFTVLGGSFEKEVRR